MREAEHAMDSRTYWQAFRGEGEGALVPYPPPADVFSSGDVLTGEEIERAGTQKNRLVQLSSGVMDVSGYEIEEGDFYVLFNADTGGPAES